MRRRLRVKGLLGGWFFEYLTLFKVRDRRELRAC